MNRLTETQAAYIAGIIDGEGCLRARKDNGSTHVAVSQKASERALLDFIQETTGIGAVYPRAEVDQWEVRRQKDVLDLLEQLLPYLRVKQSQARLLKTHTRLLRTRPRTKMLRRALKFTQQELARLKCSPSSSSTRYPRSRA